VKAFAAALAVAAQVLGAQAPKAVPAQPPSPLEVVQGQMDAYNNRDVDAFLGFYAKDAKVYRHPATLLLDGHEAMAKSYTETFQKFPKLHCELVSRMVQGAYVFDQETVSGMGAAPGAVVVIYEVRQGLIAAVWIVVPD
jgi:hypothetical protein